jgi:site-specific recombinase XerD
MVYRYNTAESTPTAGASPFTGAPPFTGPSPTPDSSPSLQLPAALHIADLERLSEEYFSDCDLRLYSQNTIETRRVFVHNLLWFLSHRQYETCGVSELRQFFYYLAHGHEEAAGRFGNKQLSRPARPITIKDYYIALRALFDWFVAQGLLDATPFASIPKPQVREEFKTALTVAQITSLLRAAQVTCNPSSSHLSVEILR